MYVYTHTQSEGKYLEPGVGMVNFYMWFTTLLKNWHALAQFVYTLFVCSED